MFLIWASSWQSEDMNGSSGATLVSLPSLDLIFCSAARKSSMYAASPTVARCAYEKMKTIEPADTSLLPTILSSSSVRSRMEPFSMRIIFRHFVTFWT
jgi:hypothetical protein